MSRARALVPWLGALAYFVAVLSWLETAGPAETQPFAPGSVHATGPAGMSLAYEYLRESRGAERVAATAKRLGEPGGPAAPDVVFRIRPARGWLRRSQELVSQADEAFVRAGGRLVIAAARSYTTLDVKNAAAPPRKVFPIWPGVFDLRPDPVRALAGRELGEAQALFASGAQAMIARRGLGRGDVVMLAAPELLENRLLRDAHHLLLLEVLAGSGRRVYFDERVHGVIDDPGLFELLAGWGLGPALLLGALAGVLVVWRGRARLGPPDDEYREARSDAVDLVDSLGQLYERTLGRNEALLLHVQGFERLVAARTGLKGEALRARVTELLGRRPPPLRPGAPDLTPVELSQELRSVNDAYRRLMNAHAG